MGRRINIVSPWALTSAPGTNGIATNPVLTACRDIYISRHVQHVARAISSDSDIAARLNHQPIICIG